MESYKREWDDDLKTFKQNAKHDWASHGAKAFQYLCQSTLMSRPKAITEEERAPPREPGQITIDEAWELNEVKRYARV